MEFVDMISSSTDCSLVPPQALTSEQSGVNGAVNGRSASSSAVNIVMSTSSCPSEMNKVHDDFHQSHSSEHSDSEIKRGIKRKAPWPAHDEHEMKRRRLADTTAAQDRHCDDVPLTSTSNIQTIRSSEAPVASANRVPSFSSPKHSSPSSPSQPQPLDLSLLKKPLLLSSIPKPSPLGSINPSTKPTFVIPSGRLVQPVNNAEESQTLKQDPVRQSLPPRQNSQSCSDTNLILNLCSNEAIGSAAEVSDPPVHLCTFLSPLDPQIKNNPSLHSGLEAPTTSTATQSKDSPSHNLTTVPGAVKQRQITDERLLRLPLDSGWRRETRIKLVEGRLQGQVAYFDPSGKEMRRFRDVMKYLTKNGLTELSRDNFSFSSKIKVGDFYEAREGAEGLQWRLLPEDDIVPIIRAMDGRCNRAVKLVVQPGGVAPEVGEENSGGVSELLRKQQSQAISAAREYELQREQMKILKEQEKTMRLQQRLMEKERRAQQILEEKRKKYEAMAIARAMEAEKKKKEQERKRQEALILMRQEEERRKQYMLMKAAEAQKKAEERERLKKEKENEKRLNKERKLELRRLEWEKAKELEKQNKERKLELRRLEWEKAMELERPNEDLCLADHKPLPELSRIPGLVLSGTTFADCLMVLDFLHRFGKALGFGLENSNTLTMNHLQEGLLNIGESMSVVQDLLVNLLSAALCDPGMPAAHRSKTMFGEQLTDVEINRDNVSEILQLYMESHSDQKEAAVSLMTKAFQAHSPSQKASMLAHLVNELCSSKAVISEIDKNITCMTNLKKDKSAVEGKIHKLRRIRAKKAADKDSGVEAEDNHTISIPTITNKRKKEEEDEDDEGYNQGDDVKGDEEDSRENKRQKMDLCDEEASVNLIPLLEPMASSVFIAVKRSLSIMTPPIQDDIVHSASTEELEKEIEKEYKQRSQIQQKMLDSSHSLRSEMIGQDRYKRRYWVLPHCHSILVEGLEGDEVSEEIEECKQPSAAAGTPSLPFSGTSPSPLLDHGSQHTEGEGGKENSNNESKTPAPPSDNLTSASFPAVNMVKTQDYSTPQPIPEEMLRGWWTVSDNENLQSLAQAMHSRGIREKVLQKQIYKHMEDVAPLSADSNEAIDLTMMEKQTLSKEMVDDWRAEEHAMNVDITLLQQVEALEKKVIAAGLQAKQWKCPKPQSHREDLIYHEHKPLSSPPLPSKGQSDKGQEDFPGSVVRRPNNPLDIAVTRLAELERHIKRSSKKDEAPGMRLWREAVGQVHSSAQLSLCIQQLQRSITWEPAILPWYCQFCHKGGDEARLLLCDGCERSCHTYCLTPKLFTIPKGDWFCPACITKESETAGRRKRSIINTEDASRVQKKGTKEPKKRKRDDSPSTSQSCAKKAKTQDDK